MKTTLVFSNRDKAGKYNPTTIDKKKEKTNRLTSVCGKYYTVITESNQMLEFVGKRNFNKWAKNNNYVTDF